MERKLTQQKLPHREVKVDKGINLLSDLKSFV